MNHISRLRHGDFAEPEEQVLAYPAAFLFLRFVFAVSGTTPTAIPNWKQTRRRLCFQRQAISRRSRRKADGE